MTDHDRLIAREIVDLILDAGILTISVDAPFVWSSGLRAPLYCDHRALLAHVGRRRRISQALASLVRERFGTAQAVAAVAQAATPYAAWVAELLDLPLLFVRREPKGHGHTNQIEGARHQISSAVIIEDVVSTGGSVLRVAQALRDSGISVTGAATILDYQISGDAFEKAGLPLAALYTYQDLRDALEARGEEPETLEILDEWHRRPWPSDLAMTHSAGGVVVNGRQEILVVNQDGITWSLPKGHLEKGEEPLAAAVREISEETGIDDVRLVAELGSYSRFAGGADGAPLEWKTITMFLFTCGKETLRPRDPANPQAAWIAADKVADVLSNPADKAFFRKIRKLL